MLPTKFNYHSQLKHLILGYMGTDQIVIYQAADGQATLDVKLENDTIWLSLNQLTTLFERDKSVISRS